MSPFLDSGFLLTLLVETNGSPAAWEIIRKIEGALFMGLLQLFTTENRLQRQIQVSDATAYQRAAAAASLQIFRWLLDQQVFQAVALDYNIAIQLAQQWHKQMNDPLPALLLLWPAMAVTSGATHFLSFDQRTRSQWPALPSCRKKFDPMKILFYLQAP